MGVSAQIRVVGSGDGEISHERELATLYQLTDALYRATSSDEIYNAALDAITGCLAERASILLFDDSGVMRFVAWRGLSDPYRQALEGHSPWSPSDISPPPILVTDIDDSGEAEHTKALIRAEGIRGLAFIPLVARQRVIGKFMIYHRDPHVFTPGEVQLAVTIARQLGFSIERRRNEEELRESEGRFRFLSENAPVMLWMSDQTGRCQHLNAMLRDFWGVDSGSLETFDWGTTTHPDDSERVAEVMGRAIRQRQPASVEARYRNRAGQYRLLRTTAHPRFSPAGDFLGLIGVNVDLTELREADRSLRESEERLRLALAAGRMGTWRYDLRTGEQWWDGRQYGLFGIDPAVSPTRDLFLSFVDPEDLGDVAFEPATLPGAGEFLDSEFRIRKPDGSVKWIRAHSTARYDDDHNPVEMIGVNFDVTAQKETEESLKLLVAELNHRVKNTLAVVQAIARQTFREAADTQKAWQSFEGRLVALAAAHNLLTRSKWESARLTAIAEDAFFARGMGENRRTVSGPDLRLAPKHALALSLVLHELCTNATKYGALSDEKGKVTLTWTPAGKGAVDLEWIERGGPPVPAVRKPGFGSRLLERSLARDLGAVIHLDFAPEGVRCTIKGLKHL